MSDCCYTTRKIRVHFTKEVEFILDGQSRICNWLYNHLLETAKADYANGNNLKLMSDNNLRNLVPKEKKEHKFLSSVHAAPLKNAVMRLKESFQRFFKEKKGFPKFKSWKKQWFSLLFEEFNRGWRMDGKELQISLGLGEDRKRKSVSGTLTTGLKLRKNQKLKTFRLTKDSQGRFWAMFTIGQPTKIKKPIEKSIFIDPNHKNLMVALDSDGNSFEFAKPDFTKYFDEQLDKLKSKRDKCQRKAKRIEKSDGRFFWKPSKRWERLNKAMQKAMDAKREQTKQCIHNAANWLCRNYGDYAPDLEVAKFKTMHRAMLNQTWIGQLRTGIQEVCIHSGKSFTEVNEKGSTATCCCCGDYEKKDPSVRFFVCKSCNRGLNRDINSCVNHGIRSGYLSGSDWLGWSLDAPSYIVQWNPYGSRWAKESNSARGRALAKL